MNNAFPFDPLGLPAPVWLLMGLKVFGFWVHMIFMNLWFAGIPVALALTKFGGNMSEGGHRLMKGMPVFIAFGINAGVVPLLFMQVLYPQFFYTSTILQGWAWLSVLGLVMIAYYCTYIYVLGTRANSTSKLIEPAAWVACVFFLIAGGILVSQMQLLTHPMSWPAMMAPSTGAAVEGSHFQFTASSTTRWMMMFGMSFGTVAAYLAFDSEFSKKNAEYTADMKMIIASVAGVGALFYTLGATGYSARIYGLAAVLGWSRIAGYGPLLVLGAAVLYFSKPGKLTAALMIVMQLLTLLGNAIARQIVQAKEISRYFDFKDVAVNTQLSPIILFLATLVVGLGVVTWLLVTYVKSSARAIPSEPAAAGSPAAYR